MSLITNIKNESISKSRFGRTMERVYLETEPDLDSKPLEFSKSPIQMQNFRIKNNMKCNSNKLNLQLAASEIKPQALSALTGYKVLN